MIGAGYEPTGFAPDDTSINLATDAFFSEDGGKTYSVELYSQAFVDATLWQPGVPALADMSAYDRGVYPHGPNGSPAPFNSYGYWEEMAVPGFPERSTREWLAFSSSVNSSPPYDAVHLDQMQLETWMVPYDRQSPAFQATHFNSTDTTDTYYQSWPGSFSTVAARVWVSPTSWDAADGGLYVMVAPNALSYSGPPSNRIYKIYPRPTVERRPPRR